MKHPNTTDTILINREPYLLAQEINSRLRLLKTSLSSKKIDALIYTAKCLEERFSIESDFGYGDRDIINCENEIAEKLQCILDIILHIGEKELYQNIKILDEAIAEVNFLLNRRKELKKH